MPREQRAVVETVAGPSGLVASAVRLTGRPSGRNKKPPKPPSWYMRAWEYFDTIGEYRYAVTWVGNLLSRATLEVREDGKISTNKAAIEALESLFGGSEGQREMLRQLGTHLTVTGDSYIIAEDMGEDPDKWQVVAASRITNIGATDTSPGVWKIDKKALDDPLVIRLWRPHPLKAESADSPSRAVLNILHEIEGFTKHVDAQISSRLTGAGILTIPSEITFGTVRGIAESGDKDAVASSGVDAFLREFIETVATATADPGDSSARVPIILQGPGEYLDKVQLITLWTELDAQAKDLRDEAIRRLALGMDMPPEILTGTGEMNHWNSWQVEEASIKSHTEPLLQIITTSLSESYLRPYLESEAGGGLSKEEARSFSFHADTSKIRLRPNRSKEAIELYNLGELSAEAMLRENGFDPADAMGDEERKIWLTKKVAGGSTTPELVAHALKLMGVDIPDAALVLDVTPTEAPSDPSLLQHPTRDLPERNDDAASASVVVFRALERAGSRLKQKYKANLVPGAADVPNEKVYRYAHVTSDMLDDLLTGAWDCLPTLGIRTSAVSLDTYVRGLLLNSDEFTRTHFANHIGAI